MNIRPTDLVNTPTGRRVKTVAEVAGQRLASLTNTSLVHEAVGMAGLVGDSLAPVLGGVGFGFNALRAGQTWHQAIDLHTELAKARQAGQETVTVGPGQELTLKEASRLNHRQFASAGGRSIATALMLSAALTLNPFVAVGALAINVAATVVARPDRIKRVIKALPELAKSLPRLPSAWRQLRAESREDPQSVWHYEDLQNAYVLTRDHAPAFQSEPEATAWLDQHETSREGPNTISAFAPGRLASNSAPVAVIKAAMQEFGADVVVTKPQEGGLSVRMQDGFETTLTPPMIRAAARESELRHAPEQATLLYAAMAARLQATADHSSFSAALQALDDVKPADAINLLGLEHHAVLQSADRLGHYNAAIASSPRHTVMVTGDQADHKGEAVTFDGTDTLRRTPWAAARHVIRLAQASQHG